MDESRTMGARVAEPVACSSRGMNAMRVGQTPAARRAPSYPGRSAVLRLVAGLSVVLLGLACQRSAPASDGLRFPPPDRPVARIISPSYSPEERRDAAGEAD